MDYKVVVTAEAEEDLNQFIQYLLFAKKNKQAAKNVLDDFEDTIKKLKYVASSLNVCDNPRLQSLGYRRINFQQHRYFMLYRIENDVVYVDDIFHELQDVCTNKMMITKKYIDCFFIVLSIGLITTQFLHVFFRKFFVRHVPDTVLDVPFSYILAKQSSQSVTG